MNAAIANDRNTDHVDLLMSRVESSADATARALVNTVLSPRFYTTDFAAFDRLDIEPVRAPLGSGPVTVNVIAGGNMMSDFGYIGSDGGSRRQSGFRGWRQRRNGGR